MTVTGDPPGVASVLTYHNDDVRDGANLNETTLNPSKVNSQQFGKLFALPVDGQVYAQPLYLPNLTIGGAQHNVLFVATENDTVYAFDADTGSQSPLWSKHLATPLQINDQEGIKPLLGITSTPVIDSTTGTMYVLTDGLESGQKKYRLHAGLGQRTATARPRKADGEISNSTGTPILRKNLQCYRRFLLPEFRDSSTIPPSFHRLSLLASERLLEADLLVIGFLLIFPVWERLLA